MKKTVAILVLMLATHSCFAQKFKEWFRQKKTQKEYLIEQIAHLKLYLELTEKGYKIAKEGLTTIGDIKRGEFKLHTNRFDSLRIVSAAVGSHPRLKQLTDLHGRINQVCENLPGELAGQQVFSQSQLDYIRGVLDLVYDDCQGILYAMFDMVRSGNTSMTDDERIKRIDLLCGQMQDNYLFVKSFAEKIRLLASQITTEKTGIENSRVLHGIK
ncbi:MAG: hypothetical protein BGO21_14910 [Dyadobacter sp. 50-39]|uniref:hypothetical protein n=1 Tax=Dyadobacter sp. 50-39 TaxID=1895756 RepID=UPI00095BD35D|nr:hypothetical protein [Dyadobacter sp. 50-39]OJV13221.1 MAG: hypothetical protein BGO21_14910 [Dyadobacter sp. 50-39]